MGEGNYKKKRQRVDLQSICVVWQRQSERHGRFRAKFETSVFFDLAPSRNLSGEPGLKSAVTSEEKSFTGYAEYKFIFSRGFSVLCFPDGKRDIFNMAVSR